MANLRISELIQRTPIGDEYFEVIISPFTPGTNRKVLLSDLYNALSFLQGVTGDGVDNTDPQNPVITINPYTYPFPQFTTATSTTAYTGTPSPTIAAYATGQKFQVKAHATSTGVSTLNLNGIGAKKWFMDPTTQATTGDIVINKIYLVAYDAALDGAAGGFLMLSGGGGALVPATQAEMITGTDNTKTATPLAVELKGSVKLRSFSNNATGSSTIDCLSQDTVHIVYTTTVTGAITIALSNDSNLQVLNVTIPITGANIAITTPSTTRANRASEVSSGDGWYQSTKILQVSSVGTADTHELSFKRKSTGPTFELIYNGPSRA